ncbi:hypothetical protein FBU31_001997 [Coemansia sp. 'formosensis']|nr:hypothetical protein FBU31_001997 [Coemansia sp. 'formosensis']
MKDRGQTMKFFELLGRLGLPPVLDPFENDAPQLFRSLAESAPFLTKDTMKRTRMDGSTTLQPSGVFENSGFFEESKENAVTAYFQRLVDVMDDEAATHNASSSQRGGDGKLVPRYMYDLADHQTKEVPGSEGLKMDLVFFYRRVPANISNVHIIVEAKLAEYNGDIRAKDFAQIADYQYSVWKAQRTRAFVPILFLHGSQLDLIIFTRGHLYRMKLGSICYSTQIIRKHDINNVRLTMARLYYLITLPSERFGHICDVSQEQQYLRFVRNPGEDSVLATVESHLMPVVRPHDSSDLLSIQGYIKRFVHPRGRLAHVFRTSFRGETAVLKLSWTPVDRMPEGAVYELLKQAGVGGVPAVHDYGLVIANLFGYRLEYLVLEDCGLSIEDYLMAKHKGGLDSIELYNSVESIVQQALQCLVMARVKGGILHRDISLGNVMVDRDGTVRVIDWGYAKVLDSTSLDVGAVNIAERNALLETTARRWAYESRKVLGNEEAHDHITGTQLYMSIPVLAGAKIRGLADDVESLFYVILHVLARLQPNVDDAACGFDQHANKSLAMIRAGCLSLEQHFLRFFGVTGCSKELRKLLSDLRKFLFVSSDVCIASGLIVDASTPRGTVASLGSYIDAATMELLSVNDGDMLTPKKSAMQVPSNRPSKQPYRKSSSITQSLSNVGVSMGDLNLASSSLGKRSRHAEVTEEYDEEYPFGSESKRSKSQDSAAFDS